MPPVRSGRGRKAASSVPVVLEKQHDEPKDPLDFETLPLEALRKYRTVYRLPVRCPMTTNGYMLGGTVGKRTWSYKHLQRAPKREVAEAIKEHFLAESVRESETIVDFVYAVQNKDKVFKLQFNPPAN